MRMTDAALMQQLRAQNVMARYADLIDQDRLEEWLTLFTEDCDYRIVTRENESQGLIAPVMWCDNHAMLTDRIASYRNVNEYNLHYDRHVLGPLMMREPADDTLRYACSYVLLQTDLEGVTSVFSAGSMQMEFVLDNDALKIRTMRVVPDTAQVLTLLATPI